MPDTLGSKVHSSQATLPCKGLTKCALFLARLLVIIPPRMLSGNFAVQPGRTVSVCSYSCSHPFCKSVPYIVWDPSFSGMNRSCRTVFMCSFSCFDPFFASDHPVGSLLLSRVELFAVLRVFIKTACTYLATKASLIVWLCIILPPCIPIRCFPTYSFYDAFLRGYLCSHLQIEAAIGTCIVTDTTVGSAPRGEAGFTAVCDVFMQAACKCLATCAAFLICEVFRHHSLLHAERWFCITFMSACVCELPILLSITSLRCP